MDEKSPVVDTTWLERRIERLERQIRMLYDFLESKKILDEKTRQMFTETKTNSDELIEWYIKELKEKQTTK